MAEIDTGAATPAAAEEAPYDARSAAAELYGDDYHGSLPGAPDQNAPAGDEDLTPQGNEGDNSFIDNQWGSDLPDADDTGEGEGDEIAGNLYELAESQGWDPDWVSELEIPITVNQKKDTVTIKEMAKAYQINDAAEKRLEQVKQRAAEVAQIGNAVREQMYVTQRLAQVVEDELLDDINAVDWEELQRENPSEFLMVEREANERRAYIQNLKATFQQEYQAAMAKVAETEQAGYQRQLLAEHAKLVEAIPEWGNREAMLNEKQQLVEYGRSIGFTDHDIGTAADHRLIMMLRKSMLYDRLTAGQAAGTSRPRKLPKTLRAGSTGGGTQPNQAKINEARKRLRETGSEEDAAALLAAKRGT